MANKPFNTRIQLKHDTEAHWLLAVNFTPKAGELIIYDVDTNHPYPRFKVGDGSTNVNNLSFITTEAAYKTIDTTITENSSSTNLPTSAAVASYIKRIDHFVLKSTNRTASDSIEINLKPYNLSELTDGQLFFIILDKPTIGANNLSIFFSFDGENYEEIIEIIDNEEIVDVVKAGQNFSAVFSSNTILEFLYYNNKFHLINTPMIV